MPKSPSILAGALLALLAKPVGAEPSLSSVVLFDTVCLQCHDGACSGRLALKRESQGGIAGHVERYAGSQGVMMVSDLQSLLVQLKKDCVITPPTAEVPPDGVWTPTALRPLMLADRRGAFVPLGRLDAGAQHLEVSLDPSQKVHVQVVSATFDIIADEALNGGSEGGVIAWEADEAGAYFVRVIAGDGIGALSILHRRR